MGDPKIAYRFKVYDVATGVELGSFKSIDGLDLSVEIVEWRTGDNVNTQKLPSFPKTGQVTLLKGIDANNGMKDWFDGVYNYSSGGSADYKKEIKIVVGTRDGFVEKKIMVHAAWPSAYKPGTLDASSPDPWTEEITLEHSGYEILNGSVGEVF